jgi:HEAT repeats/Putative zinc-finger
MKCEEVELKMIDYLDRNLEEKVHQEIEKHLETCERCIDDLKDIQQLLNLISKADMIKPDDSLRINFYHMLHSEIKKNESGKSLSSGKIKDTWYSRSQFRIAAGAALLIAGTFIGMLINGRLNNSYALDEVKQLRSEVSNIKKTAMFTMLEDESSSDRIQAVSYADQLDKPDPNVVEVLVRTLNNDKNVNVRMAAAYALAKFADQHAVCDSLVKSLSMQADPILQVTLINILAERKVKSALIPIQKIISNKSTLKEVRAVAENSLRVLI